MKQETAELLSRRIYSGGYVYLEFLAPGIAAEVAPGQFVHLRVPLRADLVLRRPFSVFKAWPASGLCADPAAGRLALLFKPVGSGTRSMEAMQAGTTVDLIGPLGNGFPEAGRAKRFPLLVAGGYGMAALYLCAARAATAGVAFFGGRTADDILGVDEFQALGWDVRVATEDGSLGTHGRVTAPLDAWLKAERAGRTTEFFACGPNGMLKAVGDRALADGSPGWLSMDRHMGCGVGACLTCVQRIRTPSGKTTWARVCRDGPVFAARDIVWEDASTQGEERE